MIGFRAGLLGLKICSVSIEGAENGDMFEDCCLCRCQQMSYVWFPACHVLHKKS